MQIEGQPIRRAPGPRIVKAGLVIGACGIGPLLLYALVGPADGNPVGLGLLAVLTVPVAGTVLAVGLVKTAIDVLAGRGR